MPGQFIECAVAERIAADRADHGGFRSELAEHAADVAGSASEDGPVRKAVEENFTDGGTAHEDHLQIEAR